MTKEILDIVEKSRANIRALESSVEAIKEQEDNMHKNSMEVNRELDSFIDEQIELLERKRQSVKDELKKSVSAQQKIIDAQMESFVLSLGCLKSSVKFTEEALSKASQAEVLSAKNQMIQQLTELNSKAVDLRPRGKICYKLELGSPLNNCDAFGKLAKIREYDEQYRLVKKVGLTESSEIIAYYYIRPQSKSNTFDIAEKVQVKIIEPTGSVKFPVVTKINMNGVFSFSCPVNVLDYKIEVIVNGRYVHGSPFNSKDIKTDKRCVIS